MMDGFGVGVEIVLRLLVSDRICLRDPIERSRDLFITCNNKKEKDRGREEDDIIMIAGMGCGGYFDSILDSRNTMNR